MATMVTAPLESHQEPARRLMTADEFFDMPKGVNKQELVDGEVIELSPVGRPHGMAQVRFAMFLGPHVERTKQGEVYVEVGFKLTSNPDTVRAPDVSFVTAERLALVFTEEGFIEGHPDLAVEVTSPGDRVKEIEDKIRAYFAAGTRLVWVAYPDQRAVMVRYPDGRARMLRGDDVLSGEDVLPGFEVRIDELFGE